MVAGGHRIAAAELAGWSDIPAKVVEVDELQAKLIEIDGEKIKSWLSPFIMAGSPELLSIAYDWGVGNRNPMGFGMVEVVRA